MHQDVDFYNDGAVKKGTLAEDTKLRPVGWQNNAVDMENAGFVEFKGKSIVSFTPDGEVTNCTVKEPLKWKDNGVEIEVIKYSDNEILIRKSFLTAFMSARQMNLFLFFENTRHKITDECLADEHVNEEFISYTRYWGGSYVDGYKTFTRVLGKKLFYCLV